MTLNEGSLKVSMISSNTMFFINDRLNSIAGATDPGVFFGSFLVFFFGKALSWSLGHVVGPS